MAALLLLVAASALVVTGQEADLLVGEECDLTDPVAENTLADSLKELEAA